MGPIPLVSSEIVARLAKGCTYSRHLESTFSVLMLPRDA
jgi:hypothetical protein